MRLPGRLAFLLVLTALCAGAASGTARPAASAKAGRLVAFDSCGSLLGYARSQASRLVGPYGLGQAVRSIGVGPEVPNMSATAAPTAADSSRQEGVDYSGTNVQEVGVDEPDIVKTNGETLFAVANGRLNAVDVSGSKPRLLDTLQLDGGWSHELLLHGDRLLVLSRGGYWLEPMPALAAELRPYSPAQSVLSEIDVSSPSKLRLVRTLTLDGGYVAARLVGGTVRIVSSSQIPTALPFVQPQTTTDAAVKAAATRNRAVVASSGVSKWLPTYRLKRPGHAASKARPVVQCRSVRHPASFSGLGMLTVLTVNLDKGLEPVDSVAVMTDARIVYASQASLYVATERWVDRPEPDRPTEEQTGVHTQIHAFDISSPTKTTYQGTGSVPGFLLSQWSLSEFGGTLRVVSTETPAWWGGGGDSESFLTTLELRNGALVQEGRVGGLGKGERVYAVRFAGNTGYVVTFRQVDPLYTLDLSDAAHPRVLGELEIAGYSSYLHPISDDLLIGIGQDADTSGRVLGTKVSLFDVSDLRHPKLLQSAPLGQGWSEAESDPHAFLYWPKTALLVVPFLESARGFHVARGSGIAELGSVEHTSSEPGYRPQIHRSLVAGGSVFTLSDAGVASSSLDRLVAQGWAAFPPVAPPSPVPSGSAPSTK